MNEQMLGVEQVNQAVAELDTMTQQNAALVEDVSASASGLNDSPSMRPVANAVALRKAAKKATAHPTH